MANLRTIGGVLTLFVAVAVNLTKNSAELMLHKAGNKSAYKIDNNSRAEMERRRGGGDDYFIHGIIRLREHFMTGEQKHENDFAI